MDDVRAVMDAVGCERAALFAFWEGGPMAAVFAATHPERTSALVLFGTFARRTYADDYPWHIARDELIVNVERLVEVWGRGTTSLNRSGRALTRRCGAGGSRATERARHQARSAISS